MQTPANIADFTTHQAPNLKEIECRRTELAQRTSHGFLCASLINTCAVNLCSNANTCKRMPCRQFADDATTSSAQVGRVECARSTRTHAGIPPPPHDEMLLKTFNLSAKRTRLARPLNQNVPNYSLLVCVQFWWFSRFRSFVAHILCNILYYILSEFQGVIAGCMCFLCVFSSTTCVLVFAVVVSFM